MQCETCAMWRPLGDSGKGACHLVPPTPILAGIQQRPAALAGLAPGQPQVVMIHARAETGAGDFCGQWRPHGPIPVMAPGIGMPGVPTDEATRRHLAAQGQYHGLTRREPGSDTYSGNGGNE